MRPDGQMTYLSAPLKTRRQVLEDGHVGADDTMSYHWHARKCQCTPGFEVLLQSKPRPDGVKLHVCTQKPLVNVKPMYTTDFLAKLQNNNGFHLIALFRTTQRHTFANVATLTQGNQGRKLDADE